MKSINRMMRRVLILLIASLSLQVSQAHNKVVVIPMAGDDVLTQIEPTAPVAKVDPSQTDYMLLPLTTIDKITGLEWQKQDDNITYNWNDALDYCANLTLDAKTDWRLPDIVELQSIVDYGQATTPIIDSVAFPNTNSENYWSASSQASSSARAFIVSFFVGFVFSSNKTDLNFVRCVR